MFSAEDVIALLHSHGLQLVAFLSVLEGPIVSVLAGYMAMQGFFGFGSLIPVLVAGDLLGDLLFYALGRYGFHLLPDWLVRRLGLCEASLAKLRDQFDRRGGRILAVGKLTHAAGAAVLVSAGMARMAVLPFLFFNTLATIPKTVIFVVLGAFFGHAYQAISVWIGRGSLVLLTLLFGAGVFLWLKRRSR